MSIEKETMLKDRYLVDDVIGRGGMAVVYKGTDNRLGRPVAIKMLKETLAEDPDCIKRFSKEAKSAAALNHPQIISVFDTGEYSTKINGQDVELPYIVMEYVEGSTLSEIIEDKALDPKKAAEYASGILAALQYSHRNGVVHRDIKPSNIIVTKNGKIKVMDFGIARTISEAGAQKNTDEENGSVVGTAQYISPEQAQGQKVDSRSDLYSTACLLYEMLTGQPPFKGESAVSLAFQHVSETPAKASTLNSKVSPQLDQLLEHALAKNPHDRYQDAMSFEKDLNEAVAGNIPTFADAAQHLNNTEEVKTSILDNVVDGAFEKEKAEAKTHSLEAATTLIASQKDDDKTAVLSQTPNTAALDAVGDDSAREDADEELSEEKILDEDGTILPDEENEPQKLPKNFQKVFWSIIGLIAVAGGVLGFGLRQQANVEMVTVPVTANMTAEQAHAAIINSGLNVADTLTEPSTSVPRDKVTRTDPSSGTSVPKGSQVRVFKSSGPENIRIPQDLAGKSETEVRDILRTAGFTGDVTRQDVHDPDKAKDHVVSTDPGLGTEVPYNQKIVLHVSDGKVDVPDLTGKNESEAHSTLDAMKLKVQVNYTTTSNNAAGSVISQDKKGVQDQHTTVTLNVAVAPVKTTTPVVTQQATPTQTQQAVQPTQQVVQPTQEVPVPTAQPTSEQPTSPSPEPPQPTSQSPDPTTKTSTATETTKPPTSPITPPPST